MSTSPGRRDPRSPAATGECGDEEGQLRLVRRSGGSAPAEDVHFQALMLTSMAKAVWAIDAQGHIVYWNRHAEEVYGWTAQEVLGVLGRSIAKATTTVGDSSFVRAALAEGRSWQGELEMRRKDGSMSIADVVVSPLPGHEPKGAVIVAADITARKRAEKVLRENEERFRVMADSLPLLVWLHGSDGRRDTVNQAYCDYFDVTREQARGGVWQHLVHPEDAPGYVEEYTRCVQDMAPFHGEARVRRGDGRWRWMESWSQPLFGEDGTYWGRIGASADITDRKSTEEALRESEERFRVMADNLPLMVWLHDAEGRQEFVNKTFNTFFGIPREEMTEESWRGVLHPEDSAAYVAEFLRCVRERCPFHAEVRVRRGDGEWRWIESWSHPRFAGDGTYLGHLGTSADVTDRKTAQAREHEVSLRLQRALLPDRVVEHPRVEVAARYRASTEMLEVGGDWYDTYSLPGDRVGMSVGDVVGHGLEAAAAMGRFRAALSALSHVTPRPARMLAGLDEFARGPDGCEYATACCAVLDTCTGELSYASAGHPPMLLVTPEGDPLWLVDGRSSALCAALPSWPRQEARVRVQPGAVLIGYSDGLVERRGLSLDAGMERLRQVVHRAWREDCEGLCDRIVEEMTGGVVQEDDIVVVALRLLP